MNQKTQLRSPLRGYLGGKYQLAPKIIKRITNHHCYIEPFAGAAWVLFKKDPSKIEVINDLNSEVINLYRCIQNHVDAVVDGINHLLISRATFNRLKATDPTHLTDIQRAVRLLYIQRTCFGGRLVKPCFGVTTSTAPKLNKKTLVSELLLVRNRIEHCVIENLGYEDIINRYDRAHSFFYLDPPYYNCEDMYGDDMFSQNDFISLRDQLLNIKGNFLLSLNDVEEVRSIFKEFNIESVELTYSVCKNTTKRAKEVFITNY